MTEEYKIIILKLIVKLLSDDSIARKKALSIVRDMHTHLSVIIKEVEKITNKYNSFYDEFDLRALTTIFDYALSKSFVLTEYKLFKELERIGVYLKADEYILTAEGNIRYVNDNPTVLTTLYKTKIMPLCSIFEKLFNTNSFLSIVLKFVKSLIGPSDVCSNVMQSKLWESRISILKQNEPETLFLPLLL